MESLGVVEEPGLKPCGAGVRVRGLKPPAPPVSVVLAPVVDWVGCAVSALGVGGAPSAGTESGSAVVRGAGFSTPLRSGRDDRFMLGPSGMSFDVEEEESGVAGEEMGAAEEIGVVVVREVGVVRGAVGGAGPSWLRRSSTGRRRWTWTNFRRPSSRWKRCS